MGSNPTATRDDAALLKAETTDAFRTFFDRHVKAIHGFATMRVGPSDADDVVSETFAAAWMARGSFDPARGTGRQWLLGIATVQMRRHRRIERRWIDGGYRTEVQIDTHDRYADTAYVVELLHSLTAAERDVLLLVVVGDLTTKQAAAALGIAHSAARVRVHRARKRLARQLER